MHGTYPKRVVDVGHWLLVNWDKWITAKGSWSVPVLEASLSGILVLTSKSILYNT